MMRKDLLAALASLTMVVAVAGCGVPDPHSGGAPQPKAPAANNDPAQLNPMNDPGEQPPATPPTTPPPTTPPPTTPPPTTPPPTTPPPTTSPPTTPPPPSTPPPMPPANCTQAIQAKTLFNTTVAGIISPTTMCGNLACHGGQGSPQVQFISTTNLYETVTSYSQVVGTFDKATAPIITEISPGPHFSTYTPAQVTTIGSWLDSEVTARTMCGTMTSTTPTPGQISANLVAEWSGCMDLQQFTAGGVAAAMAGITSTEGPCVRCHTNGAYNMVANDQSTQAFNMLTQSSDFLTVWFTPDLTDLKAPKMLVNKVLFQKVGTNQTPFIEHPTYDPNDAAFQKLDQFYQQTMAHKTAMTCSPSRLLSPP